MLVAVLLIAGCTQSAPPASNGGTETAPRSESTTSESTAAPAALTPRVTFPDGFVVNVEIAADDELRQRGLMFRDQVRPGTGMLFFFPEDEVLSFWMKNCRVPLDMIFIDAERRIVGIMHDVPPCKVDDCPSYGPGLPSRYVLEVAGGVAKQHGLKRGDALTFHDTDHVQPR